LILKINTKNKEPYRTLKKKYWNLNENNHFIV